VDDEPYIGRIVQMQFERGPFQVAIAYDGPGALEYLRAHADVTCVLLDLNMPGMSGLALLEAIRADARLRTLPVVVVTAAGEQGQVEQARRLEVAAVVTKPFSPKKLYRQVAAMVGIAATDAADEG
jgi:two-component system chemotaxis response regulator CheY